MIGRGLARLESFTARGGISGALHQGMIFVLGAEDGMRTFDENEAYDVKAMRWFKLKP